MTSQYRIAWKDTHTGKTGVGEKLFTIEEAQALCKTLNEEHEHIEHKPELAFVTVEPPAPPAPPKFDSSKGFTPMTDESLMPFGPAHKGTPMKEVPSHYLDWLLGQPWWQKSWPAVHDYITRNKKAIDQDLQRSEM